MFLNFILQWALTSLPAIMRVTTSLCNVTEPLECVGVSISTVLSLLIRDHMGKLTAVCEKSHTLHD